MRYLCVGGSRDGEWLGKRELQRVRNEYDPMPIRAPAEPQAWNFKVFRANRLAAVDVVMLLLDGYRRPVEAQEEN